MKYYVRYLLVISLSVSISACSIGSKPGLPINHDLGFITEQTADSVTITLDAPVWLWDDRIRYRLLYDDATVIRYYNRDRWEAPLPALLERRLTIAGLRQPIHLQLQLTQFEQQFETADSANVVMTLKASTYADNGIRLLGKRTFNLLQKTVSPDAAGAITGFIALIEQAQTEIQSWLETMSDEP
jgi:cholesterol transport system auxiliary component